MVETLPQYGDGSTPTPTPTATETPTPTETATPTATPVSGTGTGLQGVYYSDMTLTTDELTRTDSTLDFDGGSGSPESSLPDDAFSVRWTADLEAPVSGRYGFHLTQDDSARVWLDGNLLLDTWGDTGIQAREVWVTLSEGQYYDLTVTYADLAEDAAIRLEWLRPGDDWAVVPSMYLYPTSGPIPPEPSAGDGHGLRFTLHQTPALNSPIIMSDSPLINVDWGMESPDWIVAGDGFGVRWDGAIRASFTETYTFTLEMDGGARLWVDNELVIDDWSGDGPHTETGTIALAADTPYDIVLEYTDPSDEATLRLKWASASLPQQVVPRSVLFIPELPA